KGLIVLTNDDKDIEATVNSDTRFMGADNKPLADKLKDKALKEGAQVMFKGRKADGKFVLEGLKLPGQAGAGAAQKQQPPIEKVDTSALKPLPELGKGKYKD